MMTRPMARNLLLFATYQALGQAVNTMMFTSTVLSISSIPHIADWATLPMTLQHLGVMLSVFPAAMLMQRMGWRFGFRVGSVFGMIGASTTGLGLYYGQFLVMCAGGLILGHGVASLQMYRFAAVELVDVTLRPKAIAWVMAGGVAAAFLGPTLARRHFRRHELHQVSPSPPPTRAEGVARSLRLIAAQPDYLVAVIAAMMSFGTMSFLMSASPLAIVSRGLPQTEAHWVILLHVLGMFVPSFFTGNLIQRYGVLNIMLVGATMLVTTTYRPAERGKAQALNDFLVFGTTATCSLLAGLLQSRVGWFPLNWQSVVLIVAATLAVAWLWLRGRRPALA